MRDNETPAEKTKRQLTTVPRLFAVCLDGIWRMVYGVYATPLKEPFKVKCIFNGKEVLVTSNKKYIDYHGYNSEDVEYSVIKKNIGTLPKPKIQIEPPHLPPRRGRIMPTHYRAATQNWGDFANTAIVEQRIVHAHQQEAQPAQGGTACEAPAVMNVEPDGPERNRGEIHIIEIPRAGGGTMFVREVPVPGGNVIVPIPAEPETLPEGVNCEMPEAPLEPAVNLEAAVPAPEEGQPTPAPQTQP
jgi:hypothetical protein